MDFDKVYTVNKEHSKEQFIRAAMIKLASNPETPVDVVKADFGEVKESVKEVILCAGHVEADYTASIGYDRQEQYETTESKRLDEGDWYTYKGVQKRANHSGTYYVDVVKTRTVTDWHPYSGHIEGDAVGAAINGDEECSAKRLIEVVKETKDESVVEGGEAVLSPYGLEEVKEDCRAVVEARIELPGDHRRNFNSNASVDVNTLECWKLPFYEVEYTYKGKQYKVADYACGDFEIEAECPPNDVNIAADASRDTKSYRIGMIVGWPLFGLLYVLSWVLIFVAKVYWMWIPATAALGIAITFHVVSNKKYIARIRELTEDNVTLKQKELESSLSRKGYEKLTATETSLFDAKSTGNSYVYKNKRKGVTAPAILSSIVTAILIMVSLAAWTAAKDSAKYAALHSPEQFTIAITSKTQEYKDYDVSYANWGYFVYLTYDVTSKEIGARHMQLQTTVYDKSGREIGSIRTELTNMNMDSNAKKQYSTYLKEERLETSKNKLFVELYNSQYSDLTFKIEILSIDFSDGVYRYYKV